MPNNTKQSDLEEINEKVLTALSLLTMLETDLYENREDKSYYRAVKVIHGIVTDAQQGIEKLF